MNNKNKWIIALLLVGVVGLTVVEGYLKPQLRAQEEQYKADQQNPLTHDFQSVLRYQSKYMGDASNLINLNHHLPLSAIPKTFQLYPEEYKAELIYQRDAASVDDVLLKQALLYNATANFVLIENLERYQVRFPDVSYTFSRTAIEQWYGGNLQRLLEKKQWDQEVRDRLAEESYVKTFFKQVASAEKSSE
ncbi:DUF4825 domain-containing protein [Brevibacillus ruminantium]|uniref:DUF4825 domain-containing protein n=1 Tax=Brevibacillus ruminantium TaxID=2950604 RepID=A0ABY4WIY2_9BACL|nr:DUF4825 domain-containing protein [Brevibacillus ruminantium]USG66659.1 DUF4825 domain-containing protein [Brevibacillus ruminantium]